MPEPDLTRLLCTEAAAVLGVDDVPADRPLRQLGLDSLMAVTLQSNVSARTGMPLTTETILRHGSCAAIARYLVSGMDTAAAGWLRVLRPAAAPQARIVGIPGMGGTTASLVPLIPELPEGVELLGVELPGREFRAGERPVGSVTELVDAVAGELAALPPVPTVLYGHSQGAWVAWEVTRRLPAELPVTVVAACSLPPLAEYPEELTRFHALTGNSSIEAESFRGALPDAVVDNEEILATYLTNLRTDIALWHDHACTPEPTNTPIVAISAEEDTIIPDWTATGWSAHTTGRFTHRRIPGPHSAPIDHPTTMATELLHAIPTPTAATALPQEVRA